ncbi:hypothetical protein VTK26DRAFT_6204 [Humicola hyalothermophila]
MENEIKQATRLLQAQRIQDRDEQPLYWLRNRISSQAGTEFTAREVNRALAEVVQSDGSVGLVKALLTLGGDVNFVRRRNSNPWSKLAHRNQPGERSNLLLQATLRCRPETVRELAARADQANLDSVLPHAIARGNLTVLSALLEHGASPVQLHDDFQDVVYHNRVDIVKALLSGHHLPCLACRSTGLRIAVENRSLEVVRLLLQHWGDVNYGDAIALIRAVEISRPDFVETLISGPVRPSPRSLDAAVGTIWNIIRRKDTELNREILELCLSAGAAGLETTRLMSDGLLEVIKHRQIHLLDIILRRNKPVAQFEAAALIEAIRTEQLDALVKLLESGPSPSTLTAVLSQAVSIGPTKLRLEATRLLIKAGARGPCAAEALVNTVHCLVADSRKGDKSAIERDTRLFHLLLHEGRADVDFGKGEALQVAVRSACVEVVEEILTKEPSPDSLGASLSWAMDVPDGEKKQLLVELLLRRQVNEDAAGRALVAVFKEDPGNTSLMRLLLNRASVNYNNGEVFTYAIRNFRSETFHLLLSQGIGYKPLFTAIQEALRAPRPTRRTILGELMSRLQLDHLNTALKHVVLEEQSDLALAKMLLEAGAESTHDNGLCVKHAASTLDRELLRLLSEYSSHSDDAFTHAFSAIIARGRQWIAYEHIEVVEIMLQHGASIHVASKAMLEVVDHLACQHAQAGLAETLLRRLFAGKADVNYENGKAISTAASRGDPFILSLLLTHGATASSATLALAAAIMAHHEETLLMQLIGIFANPRSAMPDFNRSLPGMPPPIFMCLKSYGTSVAILDNLVNAGCQLDTTLEMQVCTYVPEGRQARTGSSESEPVSVLMWAVLQEEGVVDLSVIKQLVRHGADVSYTTPRSKTTPLILAAKSGRVDIARILLESGARLSAKDALGHSALFYGSRAGNADLVSLLLEHKPPVNDGSLHEASRGFHAQTMRLLLEAGHDPNYRSTKHGGRTALGEIALKASQPTDLAVAEDALDLLSSVEASPLLKVHGKTVIFLALDNQNNESITRLLLDRMLYRTLNSHENTYQHGIYHYSPTMYISKGLLLGPRSESLLLLLRDHGGEDRFYATIEEIQPPDAVGLPDEIRDYERERRARERRNLLLEQEHATRLRHERERALTKGELSDDHHARELRQQEERSQQQRRQRGLDHQQAVLLASEKHHNDAQIRVSDANVTSQIRWQRHNDTLAMQSQTRAATLAHRQLAAQQRLEARDARHAQTLAHRRDVHAQRWQEIADRQAQQLEYLNRKGKEEDERRKVRQILGQEAARERHEMKMTELRTQRGNIIGQVNLEELRRWQEESRALAAGQGQGQGGEGGVGGAGRVKLLA